MQAVTDPRGQGQGHTRGTILPLATFLLLLGIASYALLMGKIHRIDAIET